MASNKLINIEINTKEKKNIILLNVIKMLTNRDLLENNKIEENHNKIIKQSDDNDIFKIHSNKIKKDIFIKFIYIKLTTIRKLPIVDDFFLTAKNGNKIVIVENINIKAYKQFLEYPNTEVFWEDELMINLVDSNLIPKHIVLSEEEKEECMNTYQIKKRNLSRIFITDPVARYYNMKINDIVRIERYSINSGINISYRIIVDGTISIFK